MIPVLVMNFIGVDYLVASFFGGTSLLICVSVAIDLVQKIEGHASGTALRTVPSSSA